VAVGASDRIGVDDNTTKETKVATIIFIVVVVDGEDVAFDHVTPATILTMSLLKG
jgi:hypothetical protein